jgi:hypothetical protein
MSQIEAHPDRNVGLPQDLQTQWTIPDKQDPPLDGPLNPLMATTHVL